MGTYWFLVNNIQPDCQDKVDSKNLIVSAENKISDFEQVNYVQL